ncbi:MAG: hypothetical protein ABIH71_00105 [Candidatus Omnitrophota bacterium]|nr:hypothetical protein [Candidatus Omnitrophota bacterium]
MKTRIFIILGLFFCLVCKVGLAEEVNDNIVIQGVIEEISKTQDSLTIDGNKIIASPEFFEESFLEVGDKVKIITKKDKNGLEIVSYEYIWDDSEEENMDKAIDADDQYDDIEE